MSSFDRPDLMVIGDSLPQGCRSLSVTRDFCSASYSAQMAALAGISFNAPQHPRPILFDLEEIAGDLIFDGLPAFFGGIDGNYAGWIKDFAAGKKTKPDHFDNLAVTGFTIEDALGEPHQADGKPAVGTPALADAWLKKTPRLDVKKQFGLLSDLHVAVNARYVLNPGNDPAFDQFSQVDWVLRRRPRHLIVHIGHNNGLYAIGSRGDLDAWDDNWSPARGQPAMVKYRALIDRLVQGLPDTNIKFIGLPKIGAVSNLMPLGAQRLPQNLEYFARYETQFPFRMPVDGATICTADADVRRVNSEIEAAVTAANAAHGRLSFFSAYGFFQRFDTKNLGEAPLVIGGQTIDNNYIEGAFRRQPGGRPGSPAKFKWEFERGGLQSIDGMHPTSLGYAALAIELLSWIRGADLPPPQIEKYLAGLIKRERLVWQFPQGLPTILGILAKISHTNQTDDERTFNDTMQNAAYVSA